MDVGNDNSVRLTYGCAKTSSQMGMMSAEPPLNKLIDDYYGRIRRAASLLTSCTWDADDLTQETFARAAEGWARFEGKSDTFTWLYAILLNTDRSRRRRVLRWLKCRARLLDGRPAISEQETDGPDTEGIWNHVATLSPLLRQAVTMRFGEGWSYQEIASMSGCNETTARTRVARALGRLRLVMNSQVSSDATSVVSFEQGTVSG